MNCTVDIQRRMHSFFELYFCKILIVENTLDRNVNGTRE